MALVKTVRLNIVTDPGDSRLKLDAIDEKARKLGQLNPEIKVQIDTAAANLKLAVIREELKRIGSGPTPDNSATSGWARLKNTLSGIIGSSAGAGGASGLSGITSSLPLVGSLGAPAFGALAAAAVLAGVALAPVAAALIPITLGFGTLAAFAGPEVVKVFKAMTAQGTALKTAMKNLSPAEKDLLTQLQPLKDQFGALKKAVQPEIMKSFGEAIKIVKDLMPAIGPLVRAAAKAFAEFLKQLLGWLNSPQGQSFVNWLRTVGPRDIENFGRVMWDIAKTVGQALNQIYRAGSWIDRFVTRWHEDWVIVKNTFVLIGDALVIFALRTVSGILEPFTHIPFIGKQFAKARDAVNAELGKMETDARTASQKIQAAWDSLHAKSIPLNFDLNLPTGVHITTHGPGGQKTGHAAGTAGAAPGWAWVGEAGPELVRFRGGETVLPSHVSLAVGTPPGYAAGVGYNVRDVFHPSVAAFEKLMTTSVTAAENAIVQFVRGHSVFTGGFPGGFGGQGGPGGGAPSMNAALAQLMYGSRMRPGDWNAWNYVAMRESGWNQFATNPTSGAYGIPQALPFSKMPRAAWPAWAGGSSNPAAQISWMWNYMAGVYGGPQGAAAHEMAFNWYDRGGFLPQGLSLALNTTGSPERVGGGDTYNITVNMPPGSDGADVVRALQNYAKRNGPIRLKVRS